MRDGATPAPVSTDGVRGGGSRLQTWERGLSCVISPTLWPPEAAAVGWFLSLWHIEVHILPILAEMGLLALTTYCSLFFLSPFLCIKSVISVGG